MSSSSSRNMNIPSEDVLTKFKRHSLQTYAKKFNLKANLSSAAIIQQLTALRDAARADSNLVHSKDKTKRKRQSIGHNAGVNDGDMARPSKKSKHNSASGSQEAEPSETIQHAESYTDLTEDHPNDEGAPDVARHVPIAASQDHGLCNAAMNEARFRARTAQGSVLEEGNTMVFPMPVKNGIKRLREASGKKSRHDQLLQVTPKRARRLARRLLRGQSTVTHAPVLENIETVDVDDQQGGTNATSNANIDQNSDPAVPQPPPAPAQSEGFGHSNNVVPIVRQINPVGDNRGLFLMRVQGNGQVEGPPLLLERIPPPDHSFTAIDVIVPQTIMEAGARRDNPGHFFPQNNVPNQMLIPATANVQPKQINPQAAPSHANQMPRIVPQATQAQAQCMVPLQQEATEQVIDLELPMARHSSVALFEEKLKLLMLGIQGRDDGDSTLLTLNRLRWKEHVITDLQLRCSSTVSRFRREQWRMGRIATYINYWNPEAGRDCTSRKVLRVVDEDGKVEESEGAVRFKGPISDKKLWGDAAKAGELSGLMDRNYARWLRRKK